VAGRIRLGVPGRGIPARGARELGVPGARRREVDPRTALHTRDEARRARACRKGADKRTPEGMSHIAAGMSRGGAL